MSETVNKAVERSLIAAGFGGQGLMVLGQLVAYAGNAEGRYVTWIPSYGPEMRGGTANCTVVVSDEKVGSPVVSEADAIVVMNQPSFDKFKDRVNKGGVLLYDGGLVHSEGVSPDVRAIDIPANEIARKLGNEKVANIVMLGALVAVSGIVSDKVCVEIIKEKLGKRKPEFLSMNLEAYEQGKTAIV